MKLNLSVGGSTEYKDRDCEREAGISGLLLCSVKGMGRWGRRRSCHQIRNVDCTECKFRQPHKKWLLALSSCLSQSPWLLNRMLT